MAGIVKTIGKALLWMVAGVAVFVSTPLAYYYGTPLLEPAITRKADVIVQLSSGQIDDNWITPDAAQRLLGALKLYRDNFAPVIISSGSQHQRGLGQPERQADGWPRAAVPASAILVEGRSTRTYESCIEVSGIMRDHGWNSAVIVTSQMDEIGRASGRERV